MIQILFGKVVEYSTTCMENFSLSLRSRDTSWSNKSISNDRRFLTRRRDWTSRHISSEQRRLLSLGHIRFSDTSRSTVTRLIRISNFSVMSLSIRVINSYVTVSTYLSKRWTHTYTHISPPCFLFSIFF